MWLLNFLALVVIEIFIVDLSGAIDNIVKPILRKIFKIDDRVNIKVPLLGCSMCVAFWSGIIFLLCIGKFTLINFMITSLISFFTKNIGGLLRWFSELLVKMEGCLYNILK